MADISREIQDFRDAVYGEEVRGSMISLAEKVNTESTDAKTAAVKSASDAGAAASNASYAVTQANAAVQSANKAAQNIQDKADRGDFTSTIQIGEVTTGKPGTEASASNSGTPKDAVIELTIPQGYQGVSMRMAGAWTAGTEYVNNTSYIDLVTYNGSTYGCKQTHTASEAALPTNEEYWQIIAKKGDTGSVENVDSVPITFEEAEERENVETGDTITTVFGKVKKWFSSLKQAAFYDVVNNVLQTDPGQKVLDAAVGKYLDEKKFDISRLVANRNITEPGFAMDGKTLVEWLNELNGKLFNLIMMDFGNYNQTDLSIDQTVIDILKKSTLSEKHTIIGQFQLGGSHRIIIQSYNNANWGSAILFGYPESSPKYYCVRNGTVAKFDLSGTSTEIGYTIS